MVGGLGGWGVWGEEASAGVCLCASRWCVRVPRAGGFLPVVEGLDAAGLQGEALRVVLDGPVEAVQLPAARCVTMWAIKAV
jgi:hypothetical protein